MEADARLRELLLGCEWVRTPEVALALVPQLAQDLPAMPSMSTAGGRPGPGLPVAFMSAVAPALADLVLDLGARLIQGGGVPAFEGLPRAEQIADPLVLAVAPVLSRACLSGLRVQATPPLALAWAMGRMVSGKASQVSGLDNVRAGRLDEQYRKLCGMGPTDRSRVLQQLGWAVASRVSGSVQLAREAGAPADPGGLYRALLPHPLVLSFSKGGIDMRRDLGLVAEMIGLQVDEGLLSMLPAAAGAALQARASRKGGENNADAMLRAALGVSADEADAMRVLMHPVAGPALVGALPELVSVGQLEAAGVPKSQAKGLVNATGARATAAAWRKVVRALASWDVLSTLVDKVRPIERRDGRWSSGGAALDAKTPWGLFVPRSAPDLERGAVVAVRLSHFREVLVDVPLAWADASLAGAWTAMLKSSGAQANTRMGEYGLAVFEGLDAALIFARLAGKALSGPRELKVGPAAKGRSVPSGCRAGIGVAWGRVHGGTDGESTVVAGPAVGEALALAGCGRITALKGDPLGIRHARFGPTGLQNEGIVLSEAAADQALNMARKSAFSVAVRRQGGAAGGVSEDFRLYPVRAWWESSADEVCCLILLDTDAGEGASEVRWMPEAGFQEFHSSDAESARLHAASTVSSTDPAGAPRSSNRPAAGGASGGQDSLFGGGASLGRAQEDVGMESMDSVFGIRRAPRSHDGPADEDPTDSPTASDAVGSGFGFADPSLPRAAPDVGLGFGGLDEIEPASDVAMGFVGDEPPPERAPYAPSAPMILDEPDPPRVAPPMMLDVPDSQRAAPPMMLDDAELPSVAPPMLLGDVSGQSVAPPMLLDEGPMGAAPPMLLDEGPLGAAPPMLLDDGPLGASAQMMLDTPSSPVKAAQGPSRFGPPATGAFARFGPPSKSSARIEAAPADWSSPDDDDDDDFGRAASGPSPATWVSPSPGSDGPLMSSGTDLLDRIAPDESVGPSRSTHAPDAPPTAAVDDFFGALSGGGAPSDPLGQSSGADPFATPPEPIVDGVDPFSGDLPNAPPVPDPFGLGGADLTATLDDPFAGMGLDDSTADLPPLEPIDSDGGLLDFEPPDDTPDDLGALGGGGPARFTAVPDSLDGASDYSPPVADRSLSPGPAAPPDELDDFDDEALGGGFSFLAETGPPAETDEAFDMPALDFDPVSTDAVDAGGGFAFAPSESLHHQDDRADVLDALGNASGGVILEAAAPAGFALAEEDDLDAPTEDAGNVQISDDARAMIDELQRMLRGYVVITDGREMVFGIPDGALLRDAHRVDGSGVEAYQGFLTAKIADGFAMKADQIERIGAGGAATALAPRLLQAAYLRMGT